MKLYIASATANWKKVRELQEHCRAHGHEITYDWTVMVEHWKRDENRDNPEATPFNILQNGALEDRSGVTECEGFILIVCEGMRGALVEFGMACVLDTPCWVINPDDDRWNIFYALPNVRTLRGWDAWREIERSGGNSLAMSA